MQPLPCRPLKAASYSLLKNNPDGAWRFLEVYLASGHNLAATARTLHMGYMTAKRLRRALRLPPGTFGGFAEINARHRARRAMEPRA